MTQDQDLVGIHVVMQKPGSAATAVVIVQRRAAALEAIDAIWTASGKVRIHDIVDNPTLIDAPNVVTASLCQVSTGAALLQQIGVTPVTPAASARMHAAIGVMSLSEARAYLGHLHARTKDHS